MPIIRKCFNALGLAGFYLIEVIRSNVRVASDVLRPQPVLNPALIEVPVDDLTDLQLVVFANLVSMTPGSLSLDVSEDRSTLLVHALYVTDRKEAEIELSTQLKRKVANVF